MERKPDREISRIEDLFSDDYFKQIAWFDIASEIPMIVGSVESRVRWSDHLQMEVGKFKDELNRIVDKYAIYLDPGTIDIAEQLIDSSFISLIGKAPNLVQYGKLLVFAGSGGSNMVREYTRAFCKLVEIYNREASSDRIIRVGNHMWRNDTQPNIGSARVPKLPPQTKGDLGEAGH